MTSKMDMTQIDFHDLLYNLYTCYSSYNNKIYIVCHAEQMDVIFITLYSPKHTHTHTIFSLGAVHTSPRSYLEMFICELIIEVRVLSLSLFSFCLSHTHSLPRDAEEVRASVWWCVSLCYVFVVHTQSTECHATW